MGRQITSEDVKPIWVDIRQGRSSCHMLGSSHLVSLLVGGRGICDGSFPARYLRDISMTSEPELLQEIQNDVVRTHQDIAFFRSEEVHLRRGRVMFDAGSRIDIPRSSCA